MLDHPLLVSFSWPSFMELPGLNSRPGLVIQKQVWRSFGLPVSSSRSSFRDFLLVVSFGRCRFRLCPISVGLILHATIGGSADEFKVPSLSDRTFRFSVSSNLVGHFSTSSDPLNARLISLPFIFGTTEAPTGLWNSESFWKKKKILGRVLLDR